MADEAATQQNQSNQKTIAAFIAGLLVGGLLVWVFSPGAGDTPAPAADDQEDAEETIDLELEEGADEDEEDDGATSSPVTPSAPNGPAATGDGSIDVRNQPAGTSVAITGIEYPQAEGWIVVHEVSGSALGNALGAARFDTNAGLLPTSVRLLRPTAAGATYEVVIYAENGDRVFDLATDRPVTAGSARLSTTFTAQ